MHALSSPTYTRQHCLDQKDKEAHTYPVALSRTYSFWLDHTPGTTHAHIHYNQTAQTIQHSVYTEASFPTLGDTAISSKS